jgi:hypothetical protein
VRCEFPQLKINKRISLKVGDMGKEKNDIEKPKGLHTHDVKRGNVVNRDPGLSDVIVKIQHKIPRTGSTIFEHNGKYYKIKEIG